MIEQDVIDINNIPTNEKIKLLIEGLEKGKNKIEFSIMSPSKMDKFKKKIKKETNNIKKQANKEEKEEDENSDNDVIIENESETLDVEFKKRQVIGNIYLWDITDKILISDVDGTITKSDLGGQVLPRIGFDYCQNGICELLNRINSNGYRIIYLTARGIGQSGDTRNYLFNDLNVPNGAVICSSSTIRAALYREVIQKRPQDFKIPTLNMVINAFNNKEKKEDDNDKGNDDGNEEATKTNNPFIGGFGNRHTDATSYKYFGINKEKIFLIGIKKEKQEQQNKDEVIATYIKDYNEILENIGDIFPKLVVEDQ